MEKGVVNFDAIIGIADATKKHGLKDSSTLKYWIKKGTLKPGKDCKNIGRQWLFLKDSLNELYNTQEYREGIRYGVVDFDDILGISEVTELYTVSLTTIKRKIDNGTLVEGVDCKYIKSSSRWVFSKKSMDRVFGVPMSTLSDEEKLELLNILPTRE